MAARKIEEEKQTLVELAKNSHFANMICEKIITFAKTSGRTCQLNYGGFFINVCSSYCDWGPIKF